MTLRNKDVNIKEHDDHQQPHNRTGNSPLIQDHNIKFYEEYRKIFSTGYFLSQQLKNLVTSKD